MFLMVFAKNNRGGVWNFPKTWHSFSVFLGDTLYHEERSNNT